MPRTGQLHPWLAWFWSLPELYFILLQGASHLTLPIAAPGNSGARSDSRGIKIFCWTQENGEVPSLSDKGASLKE